MKQETSNKPIIVVLGMHHSGTSLTTRALQVLGVDLGEHLIPPINGDSVKEFWEDIDIYGFDNALLEKLGSSGIVWRYWTRKLRPVSLSPRGKWQCLCLITL